MDFPLLRLPYVAFHEVLRSMDPFDLMHLSKISSKAKKIVKEFSTSNRKLRSFEVYITIRPIPYIYIYKSMRCEITSDPLTRDFYLDQWDYPVLLKYSEDVIDGLKQIVECALEVLNAKIHSVGVDILAFPSKNKDIVDWIRSISESVERCEIEGDGNDEEAVEYLLNNLKITNNLDIVTAKSNTFRGSIPKLSETLFVENGQWITLERLLQFDCPEICLRNTALTSADLNKFLMAWLECRTCPNLKYFEVNLSNRNVNDVLHNLEFQITDTEIRRTLRRGTSHAVVKGGIDIHRADGATATLQTFFRQNVMHLGMYFH